METTLTAKPNFPNLHGPQRIEAPVARLEATNAIGMRYEVKRPPIVMDTMALNATVEAMLRRQMRAVMVAQKKTARSGSAVLLLTYDKVSSVLAL